MKNPILFFLLIFFLPSCASLQKYNEAGNYDLVIEKSVRRLIGKRKKSPEAVKALEEAFLQANQRDLIMIDQLKLEGQPHLWERINNLYKNIQHRHKLVKPLLPLWDKEGYQAHFTFVDVNDFERESRQKAAEYLYVKGKQLLNEGRNGNKMAARKAYNEFTKIENYFQDYKSQFSLKEEARRLGITYVKVTISESLPARFDYLFENVGSRLRVQKLNSTWTHFYTTAHNNISFDYTFNLHFDHFIPGRELVREREFIEKREIEDGFEYVLDENGNVLKDTCGNDIKVPKYIWVKAIVLEIEQSKALELFATVECRNTQTGATIIDSRPINSIIRFQNHAVTFDGDERALSEETKCRIGGSPVRFPWDEEMLEEAVDEISDSYFHVMKQWRRSR